MVSELIEKHGTVSDGKIILTSDAIEQIQAEFDAQYVYYLRWKERQKKAQEFFKRHMTLEQIEAHRKRQREHMRKKKGIKPHNFRIK